jgi:beta-ketodecanoyl-[acyl-carrier-protein] synthase
MRLHHASDQVVISGAGLWTPDHIISNEELVVALNAYADKFNIEHQAEIEAGSVKAVMKSDADFIEKASGIKQRHVYVKEGICDVNRMRPAIAERGEGELSHQAEVALYAARRY